MSPENKQLVEKTFWKYAPYFAIRLVLLFASRSLLVWVVFCLFFGVMPLLPLAGDAWVSVIMILTWPVTLTGQTGFTDHDFPTIILGWSLLVVAISLIGKLLKIHLRIRFRTVIAAIGLFFLVDAIILPFELEDHSVIFSVGIYFFMFIICTASLSIMWLFEKLAAAVDPRIQKTAP